MRLPEREHSPRESEGGGCRVSLVATVRDEAATLPEWWNSVMAQSRLPDEVVVVDGGSGDGTLEVLQQLSEGAPFPVRLEVLPGSNIAQGRNRAISLAGGEVIAVSDAGCVLHPRWLESLLAPMEADPRVELVAGFYQPLARGWFERLAACATVPLPWEVREARFMPSSRSLAFRREVWVRVGGYPEWLPIGEDMYFNHRWKEMGVTHRLSKEALVWWRMRPDLPSLLRQYFRYARGDGEAGMYPQRHAVRFLTYGWLAFAVATARGRRLWAPTAAAAALYVGRRWLRVPFYMRGRGAREEAAAFLALPALLFLIDAAKMAGYLAGLRNRAGRAGR